MNRDRIRELADVIERGEPPIPGMRFDMRHFFAPSIENIETNGATCGTVACIAGWAVAKWGSRDDLLRMNGAGVSEAAARLLGLSRETAYSLFTPFGEDGGAHNPFAAGGINAARVLRNLAETGRVDWRVA